MREINESLLDHFVTIKAWRSFLHRDGFACELNPVQSKNNYSTQYVAIYKITLVVLNTKFKAND